MFRSGDIAYANARIVDETLRIRSKNTAIKKPSLCKFLIRFFRARFDGAIEKVRHNRANDRERPYFAIKQQQQHIDMN